jgi:cytochrome c biogenesis protein CcdA
MIVKKSWPLFFILFSFVAAVLAGAETQDTQVPALMVFYSPSCHRCIQAKNEFLPKIESEFAGKLKVEYRDISEIENYSLLMALEEKYKAKDKENIFPVFYIRGRFLNGDQDFKNELRGFIAAALNRPALKEQSLAKADIMARFKSFKPLAIAGAGLVDGINPCAFTVIVFFMSFLALQGYRKRELIIIGLSFIFAVFLTYILIGLGIFGFLYSLKGFWALARAFNLLLGIFCIILGLICLYDFFKFRKTKDAEDMLLKLPQAVRNQIHKIIGLHYRLNKASAPQATGPGRHILSLFLGAMATGFLVSILEAVCTGQLYLPTIAFVLRTSGFKLKAMAYLLLYNLMFIAPLFLIFLFSLLGVTSQQFSQIFKKHVLSVKILMAVLFLGLGLFLIR